MHKGEWGDAGQLDKIIVLDAANGNGAEARQYRAGAAADPGMSVIYIYEVKTVAAGRLQVAGCAAALQNCLLQVDRRQGKR